MDAQFSKSSPLASHNGEPGHEICHLFGQGQAIGVLYVAFPM